MPDRRRADSHRRRICPDSILSSAQVASENSPPNILCAGEYSRSGHSAFFSAMLSAESIDNGMLTSDLPRPRCRVGAAVGAGEKSLWWVAPTSSLTRTYSGGGRSFKADNGVMRRLLANWWNDRGRKADDLGLTSRAIRFYSVASSIDPSWGMPQYNLGLLYKYLGNWQQSLRYNQHAAALSEDDQAAWWNLGIAATALRDWSNARLAWEKAGVKLPPGTGEPSWLATPACVRLNPETSGEVVWGERLDPARIVLLSVPLPASKHRFRDIVLNDGAANGTRMLKGTEVPVFDELEVWQTSGFETFEATVNLPVPAAESMLVDICNERGVGIEDWSTVRFICAKCSHGNPGPHVCDAGSSTEPRKVYALASESQAEARTALEEWRTKVPGGDYADLRAAIA